MRVGWGPQRAGSGLGGWGVDIIWVASWWCGVRAVERLLQYLEGRIETTGWLPGEPSGAPGTSWVVSGQTGSCEASIFPRHPRTQPAFLSSFKFLTPTCSLGFSPHKCFVELHLHGNTLLCYPGKQAFRPLLFFKKAAFFLLKKCMFIVQNW